MATGAPEQVETRGNEFPTLPRIDVELTATGPFRPGNDIPIHAVASGRFSAASARLEVVLLDDDPEAGRMGGTRPPRLLAWNGSLAAGSRTAAQQQTVRFPRPGYYRVAALISNTPAPSDPRMLADTAIVDQLQRHLWIVVDEDGGRLTAGFDSTAIPEGYYPLYGSYGPFIAKPGSSSQQQQASAALLSGFTVTGTFRYYNRDLAGPPLNGVPGATIIAQCFGPPNPPIPVQQLTGVGGAFQVSCPAGYTFVSGSVYLQATYADVAGPSGAAAGATLYSSGAGSLDLRAGNDFAARVFLDLSAYAPTMMQRFGYTKGQVKAWVSDSDLTYGINWCTTGFGGCPAVDLIRTNFSRVFNFEPGAPKWDGLFVTMHEYAHGYHHYAIEPWETGSGACTEEHGWTETELLGCAFVEGVADWLSMTTVGGTIDNSPYGGDYGLENNLDLHPFGIPTNPPSGGDGVRVEAAVAAFLYDIIDGDTELDGVNNGVGAAENHDSLAGSASGIVARMKYCKINTTITKLSGADQLVYCLEGKTNAYAVAHPISAAWRSYSTISFDQTVPALDSLKVRKLWKYNLYGLP